MRLRPVLLSMATLLAIYLLDHQWGTLPPLGRFLDPFQGFWQQAEPQKDNKTENLTLSGLRDEVIIRFDEYRIPHIEAKNNYDLYFAQGYITARDRLWQMDFQSRVASGRLSEVIGEKALELDKYHRRLGLGYAARKMEAYVRQDPQMTQVLEAYAAGINTYISGLKPRDYPLEFKLLNYAPEPWKLINSAYLLKLMSVTLASASNDVYLSNALARFGPDVIKDLFPNYPRREDPIIPSGTTWDFTPLPQPDIPPSRRSNPVEQTQAVDSEEGIGSNNWAMSGSKTRSGLPLLANDPHLELTLPAIWYQVQLTGPDVNVNGVTIPGSPGVIIGFNENVAWGVTNVGSDVLDWYQIQFQDEKRKAYRFGDSFRPTRMVIEKIAVKGKKTVSDTVWYTHHGPVMYGKGEKPKTFPKAANIPEGHAARWVAHLPSNDIKTFYVLNRARNYADYQAALRHYVAPAQNFVFASKDNDIGITPNGYFPLKWRGQGKFLLDGSQPENDWSGRIPVEHNPTVKNPPRGFVSSANQFSADTTYPYYLHWEFSGYERGAQINRQLAKLSKATPADFQALQNDNYSIHAENVRDILVKNTSLPMLSPLEKECLAIVTKWSLRYDAQEIGPTIFDNWYNQVARDIWFDEFSDTDYPMAVPSRDRTVALLAEEETSRWYDNISTPEKETKEKIVTLALKKTVDSLQIALGEKIDTWSWGVAKGTQIQHLARINGLGTATLHVGGSKTCVNAISRFNGPSWRMVISVGDVTHAMGLYPGGQSGNPGSVHYDDQVDSWAKGELHPLFFYRQGGSDSPRIRQTLTLKTKN